MSDILRKIIYNIYGWQFTSVLLCAAVMLIVWTLINVFAPKKLCKALSFIIAATNIIAIVFFTVSNRSTNSERSYRFAPFIHYFSSLSGRETLWLNAFFFLPLGLSLPYLLPDKIQRKALATILIAAAFSTCIEAVQFIFKLGLCETDDVIMNTLGAAIGTLSYIATRRINARKE